MLIENTLNNNVVTKDEPIITQITVVGEDWLEIRNNLRKKSDDSQPDGKY